MSQFEPCYIMMAVIKRVTSTPGMDWKVERPLKFSGIGVPKISRQMSVSVSFETAPLLDFFAIF